MNHEIELYLADLSGSTARVYGVALRRFVDFAGDKPISDINAEDLTGFTRHLREANLSSFTICQYTTTVFIFINWLILEERIALTLEELARWRRRVTKVRGRRPRRRLPQIPSTEAVMALLREAQRAPAHTPRLNQLRLRNIAIIQVLRFTGMRVGELVGLCCGDLNTEHFSAPIIGKGGKQRLVIFHQEAWDAIQAYLFTRGACSNGEPLFVAHDRTARAKKPLSTTSIRNMLHNLADKAGIEEEIRPHLFRHRVGTELAWQTGNTRLAQDVLGHSDIRTTQHYTQVSSERMREAMNGVSL